ncbi:MAG TPA: hypothetical protein VI731_12815 [Bacteroidia bacterium]|nr:hypothetical protein [Bacteroidia bacterium]
MDDRYCLDCEDALNGRADKKFCSDQCRNSYNNRINSDNNNFMRNVNNILRRNRRILADFTPNGKSTMPRDKVSEQGFQFQYYTHTYTTRKGTIYYFCYEYGYLFHGNDFMTIVHRKRTETLERD